MSFLDRVKPHRHGEKEIIKYFVLLHQKRWTNDHLKERGKRVHLANGLPIRTESISSYVSINLVYFLWCSRRLWKQFNTRKKWLSIFGCVEICGLTQCNTIIHNHHSLYKPILELKKLLRLCCSQWIFPLKLQLLSFPLYTETKGDVLVFIYSRLSVLYKWTFAVTEIQI